MRAFDTNILVYAHRRDVAQHIVAYKLVQEAAQGDALWAIPWPCIYEFVSVVTNRRIWKNAASTPAQAFTQVKAWVSSPSVKLLREPDDFLETLGAIADKPFITGPMIHDARIAALCLAHGVRQLVSADRDFSIFPALDLENPFDD